MSDKNTKPEKGGSNWTDKAALAGAAIGSAAIAAALAYLDSAAGVTGHLLPLDGEGAGPVV